MAAPLPSRLLGVWAHPDDECYLSAGLMARIVAGGGAVRILCATRGELGTDDPGLAGTRAFAEARERELEASLAVLGVTDVWFLGLADGACDQADDRSMTSAVAEHVDGFRPDTIVTFGPDGITGHDDHRAVWGWATGAWASTSGAELLYATMTHDHAERHREVHESLGVFAGLPGSRPVTVASHELALRCALDDAELDRKRRALAAHGSQTDGLAAAMGEDTYRTWWRDECFRRPTAADRAALGLHLSEVGA